MENLPALRLFMQHHVFAVWDFMSLLKTLQRGLTCVEVPWLPAPETKLARRVKEIVLGEESDVTRDGEAICHFDLPLRSATSICHFDLYLRAMREAGADTGSIGRFIASRRNGHDLDTALARAPAPDHVAAFIRQTFTIIAGGRLHEIDAAFTYGREDLIPGLFTGIVAKVNDASNGCLRTFHDCLQRHIELDGDELGALGREMVALLGGGEEQPTTEALSAAANAFAGPHRPPGRDRRGDRLQRAGLPASVTSVPAAPSKKNPTAFNPRKRWDPIWRVFLKPMRL